MRRFTVVLVVFVGIVLMSFPATVSAGGGPDNFNLSVNWGKKDGYGYKVSSWTGRSGYSRQVATYTYFRYISVTEATVRTIAPEGVTAKFSADPASMWMVSGFQFMRPGATMSFVGTNWGSPSCPQGPGFTYDRQSERLVVSVANTTGIPLYLTVKNGRIWSKLLPGKARTYHLKAKAAGEVRLFTKPALSSNECANFRWNPTY